MAAVEVAAEEATTTTIGATVMAGRANLATVELVGAVPAEKAEAAAVAAPVLVRLDLQTRAARIS
eukprot:7094147-Alexandrium_andersonii.AAC.1